MDNINQFYEIFKQSRYLNDQTLTEVSELSKMVMSTQSNMFENRVHELNTANNWLMIAKQYIPNDPVIQALVVLFEKGVDLFEIHI